MQTQSVIARQGLLPLLLAVLLAVLVMHFVGWRESLPCWALAALVLLLFRDPERDVPSSPMSILSPADGRVMVVENTVDPYLNRPSLHVSIEMPPYGVFTTRSPVEGKVLEPPASAETDNRHGVWLQTDEGDDVVLVMGRGRFNSKPQCYVRFGERIGQGKRCGYVRLGGKVDVFLPENAVPAVSAGHYLHAGSDVLARLVRTGS